MGSTIENHKSQIKNSDSLNRFGPWLLTALAAGLVFARLWLVFYRLYDPDELEHLHAGFCVWQGMVPYRDFFEQHGPVLWYLSLPLFAIWGASLKVLFAGRFIVWLISLSTFALTWQLGNRLYGRWGGPLASLLLALLGAFQEKNIEWRPDNVAVPLVLLAALCMGQTHKRRGWVRAGLAGAALAAAFCCTQKVAYVGLGMVSAFVWTSLWDRRLGSWRELLSIAAGAVIVAGIVSMFFATQGALGSYLRMTILLPLEWKTYEPVERYLLMILFSAPVFWGAFASGLVLSLSDVRQVESRNAGVAVVAAGAATHALGLFLVPAAFYQYYLPMSPLAALLAARAIAELAGLLAGGAVQDSLRSRARSAGLALGAAVTGLAFSIRLFSDLLDPAVHMYVTTAPAVILWLALTCLMAAAFSGVLGARRLAALALLASSGFAAQPYLWVHYGWSHQGQTDLIERLMTATSPEDQFFDSYVGFGALRPHAFYYYWINRHSWPMIPDEEKTSGVLRALSDERTRVVLYDSFLYQNLPRATQQFLEANYQLDARCSRPGFAILVRKGRELP